MKQKKENREESKKKHAGGRPEKKDSFSIEQLNKFTEVYEEGYTDKELCNGLGITQQTLTNYKNEYPEFFASLKRGKAIADAKVELSLFQRAMGYSHPDVHITNFQGLVTVTPIIKHYPPDPTSMIFWLKNRQPARWRDKQEIEQTNITKTVLFDVSKLTPDDLVQLSNMLKRINPRQEIETTDAVIVEETANKK